MSISVYAHTGLRSPNVHYWCVPKGSGVRDVRLRQRQGRLTPSLHAHACHTPVPDGGRTCHYDVIQTDTSVCCSGEQMSREQERGVSSLSSAQHLFVYYFLQLEGGEGGGGGGERGGEKKRDGRCHQDPV